MNKTMTLTIPRRRGWSVIWLVLLTTLEAYWRHSQTITFTVGDET